MKFTNSFLKKSIGTNNRGQYYDNIVTSNNIFRSNNIETNNIIRSNNIETNNIESNNIITFNNIESNNNAHFSDTNLYLEQSDKERELKEKEIKERLIKERELKEKEIKERLLKERELKEKEKELKEKEKEIKEREIKERLIKEKERELKEKERELKEKEKELKEKEIKEKEIKERELKERQLKERQLKEKEKELKEIKEKEIKEREIKERQIKEKEKELKEKEKELKEKERELKEKEIKEREIKEREIKEKEIKERELKEKEIKERELKEKEIKERELKEKERELKEKERELKEKERELNEKEKEIKERELKEREVKVKEIEVKEIERQPTECISKMEIHILKLLEEKTITIENVYQERYNNIKATGIGDFIRGSYFLMEFCDNNNILFNINILNHPISQFLEIYQNKQSLIINNINKFEELNFQPHISNNNIITNTYDSFTNNKFINYLSKQHVFNKKIYTYIISYPSEKIDEKHKEYMKQILQPCKQLELIVDNMLLELELIKKQFIIIHIRYGDDFLIKKKNKIEKNHLAMIQKILDKLNLNQKYLLISDNIIIKNILSLKYPFIKTHFNKISHTGEGLEIKTNELQNTMIDFYMFSHASRVIAFSVYQHGTGFSKWSTETYSVPYICRFLP